MPLKRFFTITPILTPGRSAVSYVPFVMLSRLLTPVRSYLVARILGDVGQREYGLYQPGLELINCLVPLVMFGLADVAERYAARFQKEGRLGSALRQQYERLATIGVPMALLMTAGFPWVARAVWGPPGEGETRLHLAGLVGACAVTMVLLAFYQHLAATLRGLRAYTAVAGMETLSAVLFLVLSCAAAWRGGAAALIGVYAVSVLIPVVVYGGILWTHLGAIPAPEGVLPAPNRAGLNRFAAWALVRLMLVMICGFLSVWGVRFLATRMGSEALKQTGDYSYTYRIAQLLAFLAVTLWSSSYGIAAAAWSHGQLKRARVQLFRVGKFGAVIMSLLAVGLLLMRGVIAVISPGVYAETINGLLPPLLAVSIWYGLLAFASTYADLRETPQRGAWLWGTAVVIQLALIVSDTGPLRGMDPKYQVLLATGAGIGFALFVMAPLVLWHPFKMSATAVPLVVLAIAPVSLFSPGYVVDWIGSGAILGSIGFLYVSGLLIRPMDRRAWRKYRQKSLRKI